MSANDMVVGLKLFGDRALAHQQRGNCALVQHGGGCRVYTVVRSLCDRSDGYIPMML
jgi:hypothetical protein